MTPDSLFSLANATALLSWILLILAGGLRWAAALVTGVIVPALLACLYITLLAAHWGETPGGFGSLTEVAALFSNRWLLLAGWVHYLAFDLFIGSWQVRDARRNAIPHLLVVPCLLLTFMFGPAGLLLYLLPRTIRKRTLFLED